MFLCRKRFCWSPQHMCIYIYYCRRVALIFQEEWSQLSSMLTLIMCAHGPEVPEATKLARVLKFYFDVLYVPV